MTIAALIFGLRLTVKRLPPVGQAAMRETNKIPTIHLAPESRMRRCQSGNGAQGFH